VGPNRLYPSVDAEPDLLAPDEIRGVAPEEVETINQVTGVKDHSTYECLA